MLFSPDCSHCKQTAEELQDFAEQLKGTQIIMATMQSLTQMNEFVLNYKLHSIPHLTIGKDMYFLLPPFFTRGLPFISFYNKQGNLVSVFEGFMSIDKMAKVFHDDTELIGLM